MEPSPSGTRAAASSATSAQAKWNNSAHMPGVGKSGGPSRFTDAGAMVRPASSSASAGRALRQIVALLDDAGDQLGKEQLARLLRPAELQRDAHAAAQQHLDDAVAAAIEREHHRVEAHGRST